MSSLWYFAYGANMAEAVLIRRGVSPAESVAATLAGYALRFNHPGMPPLEPVFANIAKAAGATVHGVAHCVTAAEAARFDSFEPGYRRINVPLQLRDGHRVTAFAYTSVTPTEEGLASARYLSLLLDGARLHSLPDELIDTLTALHTQASTLSQTELTTEHIAAVRARQPGEHLPADLISEWEGRIEGR